MPGSTATTLDEIRSAALASLTPEVRDFLEGGAGAEQTLAWNIDAFARYAFAPRLMSGLSRVDTSTEFVGVPLALPVLVAPFGADGLFNPSGHLATVTAAAQHGTTLLVPENGTHSWEAVRAHSPAGAQFAQLHAVGRPEHFASALARIEAAGYAGVCVTCDCPVSGWKERMRRHRFSPRTAVQGNGLDARWAEAHRLQLEQVFSAAGPVWSWAELERALAGTRLPWIAKGVLSAADARAALDAGARALYLSNHGGRQLDRVLSPLDVLPEVRRAVGPGVEIAIDSGVRRGSDLVIALALGADVTVVGRLAAYGLAADGARGVARVLELLRQEFVTTMTLLGRHTAAALDPSVLRAAHSLVGPLA